MSLGPLQPLAARPQFIVVRLDPLANGKTAKLPVRWDTLQMCDAHNPQAWTGYDNAANIVTALGVSYCVGYVLRDDDDWFCLDIDNCALPAGGWSELARTLCQQLPGCVVEVSRSGRGLHVWGRRSAMPEHAQKRVDLGIELYSRSGRFIAIGTQQVGTLVNDCLAIDAVVAAYFPPRERAAIVEGDEDKPRADWRGPESDEDLLRRMLQSKSAAGVFGGKASASDLFHADERVLSKAYPSDASSTEPYDRSSADAALAAHTAFWTGAHRSRMERLMRQSALVRPKWDDRPDYLQRTIANACALQRDVLQDKPSAVPEAPAAVVAGPPAIADVTGDTFLGAAEQKRLFAGCIYVEDAHRVLIPGGRLRRPDQFRAKFGGYTFFLDRAGTKTTRNAFEAFTESQILKAPVADSTCFRPALPYGTLVAEAGQTLANTYWPVDVPCMPGDPAPFLDLLKRMLPNERDRIICLSNAAAIVQYPGLKIPYATLLQGVEGNGKTTISKCLEAALGKRYTYWPKASKLGAQFNAWIVGRLLYLVEDIKAGADDDLFEMLKPLITGGSGVEVEAKGQDQTRYDDVGNFWFNSNHKNGLRKTRNDRRLCMLFCAQQTADDLIRDGLTPEYMTRLNHWLQHENGYAIVTHFLRTYQIPDEFNPAKECNRAPITSSTDEAIEQSLGAAEQVVMEAIEDGTLPGFKGGWVSSVALDRLLNDAGKGRSVPINRRRDMMRTLGYDWHPALPEGRVMNGVLPDGGKRPRLYVAKGHPSLALTSAADVARAYVAAQKAA